MMNLLLLIEGHEDRIINFLSNDKDIKTGDIIFTGSPHDRQSYGLYIWLIKEVV